MKRSLDYVDLENADHCIAFYHPVCFLRTSC